MDSDATSSLTLLTSGVANNRLDELLGKLTSSPAEEVKSGTFEAVVHPSVNNTSKADGSVGIAKHASRHSHRVKQDHVSSSVEESADESKAAAKAKLQRVSVRGHVIEKRERESDNTAAIERLFGPSDVQCTPAAAPLSEPVSTAASNESLPTLQSLSSTLHPRLLQAVKDKLKFDRMTRVQQLAWGPMLGEKDVLVRSETGSGKTLAYALPLVHSLLEQSKTERLTREKGTLAIILVPTRELAGQVAEVLQILVNYAPFLVVSSIHGGDSRHNEKTRLRKGVGILVATPGRLLDHLKSTASYKHDALQTLVLDEADRLLDMGFENTIKEILENITPRKRVLVSATVTASVKRLVHFSLNDPVTVGETEDIFAVPECLRQHYVICPLKQRLTTLLAFLRSQIDGGSHKIAVFVSTADSAEFHYLLLSRFADPFTGQPRSAHDTRPADGTSARRSVAKLTGRANAHLTSGGAVETFSNEQGDLAEAASATSHAIDDREMFISCDIFKLHGNMTQIDRSAVFDQFRKTSKGILFCTDVAARGLDMPHVDWIVHYDPPCDERCYVHRVGRTARIGHAGDSLLFLQEHEAPYVDYLRKFIDFPEHQMRPESFLFYLTKLDKKSNQMWVQAHANTLRLLCDCVRNDREIGKVALFAYQSFVRSYSTYPRQLRYIFSPQQIHLGHLSTSFAIDATPSEVRRRLNADRITKMDRGLARDTKRFDKGERMQVEDKTSYRSSLVAKQVKQTKDYHTEQKEAKKLLPKTSKFTEFDA